MLKMLKAGKSITYQQTTQKTDNINTTDLKTELVEQKRKSKDLSKELRRKDKALAETTALLVLRKKLNTIFGKNENH